MKIKTFKGRLILEPMEEQTDFGGFKVDERNITDASRGICIAVGSDITDIIVGDEVWYSKDNREAIFIEDNEYHVVPYIRAFYSPVK